MTEVDDDQYDDADEVGRPSRPPLTPAQRRARRQTITLLIVGCVLLVSFLFAAAYYGGWFDKPKPAAHGQPCTTPTPRSTLKPTQVKVNVYNASSRNGLARRVAAEMKDRGFVVGTVANDPLHHAVKTPAEVRYGPKGKPGADLVSSEVPGSKLVVDKRKDATVDLVLGASYANLTPTDAPTGTATCTPTGTATSPSGTSTKPAASSTSK